MKRLVWKDSPTSRRTQPSCLPIVATFPNNRLRSGAIGRDAGRLRRTKRSDFIGRSGWDASGACGRKVVEVQIFSSALFDSPRFQRGSLMAGRVPFRESNALSERSESKGLPDALDPAPD